jgi:hypothetical protein
MIDQKWVGIFSSLYRGRTDAWGSVDGGCMKTPVTEDNYRLHLDAKTSLGVYMLRDDGTCSFAAIDIDQKDFARALAIKNELKALNIHAYISASRSKGYHVSMYAEDKWVARDIRRVLAGVLKKLGLDPKTEIFPKQDVIDQKVLRYGNYINIPCFGALRPFMSDDQKDLPIIIALPLIKRTPESVIQAAVKALPADAPAPPAVPGKTRGPKKKHPPCISMISMGVQQGARDEAAFALARHYLDMQYTEDEVLALMKEWDKKNKPPFGNDKELETKVKSAQKGYAFGCSSIKNGILSSCCPGEDRCDWLIESNKEKKKKGTLKEITFMETPDYLFEEAVNLIKQEALYIAYNKTTGQISKQQQLEIGETTFIPVLDESINEGCVLMPNGIEEYGETLDLVKQIRQHIYKYVDMEASMMEFAAWYVLMTWVSDRLRTVGYFRFSGDTGTGKSRALDVLGRLCYKPMMLSGAITPAPIYRLIRRFRGTLVLDEADFSDSSEKSEVITILNCGFEKGRPIVRCSKDDPNTLEILPCFGPKCFATRFSFDDVALEARCMTSKMEETERDDIVSILDDAYFNEEMSLRNKLLLWRFRHYNKIEYNSMANIDIGKLEPRVKQTSLPYALMFKDFPDVLAEFRIFIHNYQEELVQKRYDSEQGKIVTAFFTLATEQGRNYISSKMITDYCNENYKLDITPQKVGKILVSLKLLTQKRRVKGVQQHYINWEPSTMRKIHRRYMADKEDFRQLFADDPSYAKEGDEPPMDLEV